MDRFLGTFGGSSSSTAGPSGNQSGRARGNRGGGIPNIVLNSVSRPARGAGGQFNRRESFGQANDRRVRGLRPGTRAR